MKAGHQIIGCRYFSDGDRSVRISLAKVPTGRMEFGVCERSEAEGAKRTWHCVTKRSYEAGSRVAAFRFEIECQNYACLPAPWMEFKDTNLSQPIGHGISPHKVGDPFGSAGTWMRIETTFFTDGKSEMHSFAVAHGVNGRWYLLVGIRAIAPGAPWVRDGTWPYVTQIGAIRAFNKMTKRFRKAPQTWMECEDDPSTACQTCLRRAWTNGWKCDGRLNCAAVMAAINEKVEKL